MADIAPPYLDPSQYPSYIDVERKQALAQMLMGSLQQSNQTNPNWDSMKVVPKRGWAQNLAPIVTALMAARAQNSSLNAQKSYYQGLYNPDTPPSDAAISQAQAAAPGIALPDGGQAAPGMAHGGQAAPGMAQPPAGNPLIPPGMTRQQANLLMAAAGPQKFAELALDRYKPTDLSRTLDAAGITDPTLRRQIMQASIAKQNYIAPVDVRAGGTLVGPDGKPTFSAAANGAQTVYDANGRAVAQNPVPGAVDAAAATAAATKAAQEANTPHYQEDPLHPGTFTTYFPKPPGTAVTAPGATSGNAAPASISAPKVGSAGPWHAPTAGDLAAANAAGKAGVDYATELAKNAAGATEVRRSLSELKNLASQAKPGASNEPKMKLGSYMIAAGVDPETAAKFLGVDVGALQAAQKQTATLAVNTIHSMTSRGTNFDLDTFMRNNPNLNMADPAAFGRVVDYMDNKAKQEVAKQKDFVAWKKGIPAEEWESGHTAHWLEQQNADIDKGRSNSRPPLSSFVH